MKTMHYHAPLGEMTLLANAHAVDGLWFDDQAYFGGPFDLAAATPGASPVLVQAVAWLDAYFAGQSPAPAQVPVELVGTPFRQAVGALLQAVPLGATITYGELARQLAAQGHPTSPRAIGGAVGHNPVSLLVPCHRVVGGDGGLTGYAGGLARKVALLTLEGVAVDPVRLRLDK
ncbi:methylated-DNA--[protein]-cysteine S-methyltransferase [Lacticaseibacillus absianus]|uniref:methylated-DNA--[protein]-cysteine S-methyltransferase n=1 Tax=Lacticaseibacillus absianus TaxID=2729623 RepID=UPI0015C8D0D4|nr:methylated-DNA--[protein]-cysteine S-methyltransferase [Lacticaseibacillus absianus]